jgi:hypothetical protein
MIQQMTGLLTMIIADKPTIAGMDMEYEVVGKQSHC